MFPFVKRKLSPVAERDHAREQYLAIRSQLADLICLSILDDVHTITDSVVTLRETHIQQQLAMLSQDEQSDINELVQARLRTAKNYLSGAPCAPGEIVARQERLKSYHSFEPESPTV